MRRRHLTPILVVLFSLLVAATPAYLSMDVFTALLGNDTNGLIYKYTHTAMGMAKSYPGGSGGGDTNTQLTSHGNFDQPDMFSGTASFTYEFRLPPGTNNMAPKLALVYRSSGGNGWFGMGWELEGLGCIERSLKNGAPNYDNTDWDFTLNMAGTTYELVPDDSNRADGNNIGYYHTKCESWMKIYYGGTYWTVTDKNGVEYRFGYTTDSKVPIVDHPALIRLWALDQVLDKHGNYMTYSYILDTANGEYYPNEISYTRNTNATLAKIKTVSFLRETRTDNVRPTARWMTHRINEIQVKVDGALVDKYTLTYRYSNCTYRSLLAAINRFGSGTAPETTVLSYAVDTGSLSWGTVVTYNGWAGPFCDVNGDGLIDSMLLNQNGSNWILSGAAINNGDKTFSDIVTNPIARGSISLFDLIDVNSDGKIDIYWHNDPFINNWPNTWAINANWYPRRGATDFNNDSIVDSLVRFGSYISSAEYEGWQYQEVYYSLPAHYTGQPDYLDFNGDGWADLSWTEENNIGHGSHVEVRINDQNGHWLEIATWDKSCRNDLDGDGFWDCTNGSINNTHGWTGRFWDDPSDTYDLNNDGLLDRGQGSSQGTVWVRLPNGQMQSIGSIYRTFYDMDDDGFLDSVKAITETPRKTETRFSNAKPDLLTQAKLPTGGKVGYEYKRVPIHPMQDGRQLGATWRQYVVSKITTDEGTGRPDAVYESTFIYPVDGGMYDRKEKTSLGFAWVEKTLPDGGHVKTYFSQEIESAGRVLAVETYDSAGTLLQRQENTWDVRAVTGSTGYAVTLANQRTYLYRNGADPVVSRIDYTYDDCANPVTEARLGDLSISGDEVTFHREFINLNQGTTYLVGLQTREKAVGLDNAVLVDKLIWYDGLSYGQAAKGLVTEEKSWLDNFAGTATCTDEAFYTANGGRPVADPQDPHPLVTYGYDAFGNRTTITKHNVRPDGTYEDQVDTLAYDSDAHCLPVEYANAAAHAWSWTWNYALGQPLTETDPNGAVKRLVYDGLGRVIQEYGPRDAVNPKVRYDYASALTGVPAPQFIRVERQIEIGAAACIWSKQYLDGFARVWKEEKQAPGSLVAVREQQYEWHGEIGKEWLPYFNGGQQPSQKKISVFDAFKRPTSVTMPDGANTAFAYDGLQTTITVANTTGNQVTRRIMDVYGRVARVEQDNTDGTYVTAYEYDGLGRMVKLLDAMRNAGLADTETSMTYDSLGRLIQKVDPYAGTTSYQYDSLGNVIKKIDAKGTTHFHEYDLLNRLVAKSFQEEGAPSSIVLCVMAYDEIGSTNGIGRLTSTYVGSSILDAEYDYDADGNITSAVKHIGGASYTVGAAYDAMARLKQLTYPDSSILNYTYNIEALATVGSYAAYSGWSAAGLPDAVDYGNNTDTSYTYHPLNLRLTNLVTHDASGGVVQDFGYTFDTVGNITALTDNAPITAMHTISTSQNFTYDKLNRLMSSSVFGSYSYDRIGNITAKEGVTFTYNYNDPAHPYCPVSGSSGYAAAYDANGNLATKTDKNGVGWRYEYDAENMLTRVWKTPVGGSEALIEEYGYGADGIRTTKTSYVSGQAATTRYVFLGNNVLYEATGEVTAKYILAGDKEIAKVVTGGTHAGTYYTHRDHIGSSSVVTNGEGEVVQWNANHPYGEDWGVSPQGTPNIDRHKFTGKETDEGTGLSYFGARYYDPEVGRFTTVDPIGDGLNWYEYCSSNPVLYTDPTGLIHERTAGGGIGVDAPPLPPAVTEEWLRAIGKWIGGILGALLGIILSNSDEAEDEAEAEDEESKERTVSEKWKDFQENPENWEKTGEKTEAGAEKGTTSYEREYTNKETGEKVYTHEVTNDTTGKVTHPEHPRAYPK